MSRYRLRIQLLSDGAFGRGDGVAGLVDSEIEHDSRTGIPFIKGRTVKGLLVEECANISYAVHQSSATVAMYESLTEASAKLFGVPGSTHDAQGYLLFDDAKMPPDFIAAVEKRLFEDATFTEKMVLDALTTIRQQTAIDPMTDAPKKHSLRSIRVLLRETVFMCDVTSRVDLDDTQKGVLVACAAGLRRGGQNRTRGLGRLLVTVQDVDNNTMLELGLFKKALGVS